MIDEHGLLRCDGLLKYTKFIPREARFPLVLLRGHCGTTLIVENYNEKGHHVSGTNQTLANLTSRYWIIAGRKEIRAWEKGTYGEPNLLGKWWRLYQGSG